MYLKEKKSLAETWVNLQAKRVFTINYRNRAFALILGILCLSKEPSIPQWPAKETAKLQISQVVMKCPVWLRILCSPLTNSIMLLKLTS